MATCAYEEGGPGRCLGAGVRPRACFRVLDRVCSLTGSVRFCRWPAACFPWPHGSTPRITPTYNQPYLETERSLSPSAPVRPSVPLFFSVLFLGTREHTYNHQVKSAIGLGGVRGLRNAQLDEAATNATETGRTLHGIKKWFRGKGGTAAARQKASLLLAREDAKRRLGVPFLFIGYIYVFDVFSSN